MKRRQEDNTLLPSPKKKKGVDLTEEERIGNILAILHMSPAEVTDEVRVRLAQLLAQRTVLALKGKEIKGNAMKILADALKGNDTIVSLVLDGIKIASTEDVVTLTESLKLKNNTIQRISMNGCGLVRDDLKHLAELLNHNPITALDIGGNNISVEGFLTFLHCLHDGVALHTLSITHNGTNITRLAEGALLKMLQRFMGITTLDLEGNDISDNGLESIERKLAQNRHIATELTERVNRLFTFIDYMLDSPLPMDVISKAILKSPQYDDLKTIIDEKKELSGVKVIKDTALLENPLKAYQCSVLKPLIDVLNAPVDNVMKLLLSKDIQQGKGSLLLANGIDNISHIIPSNAADSLQNLKNTTILGVLSQQEKQQLPPYCKMIAKVNRTYPVLGAYTQQLSASKGNAECVDRIER